jgi:hypothetical protein
MCAQGFHTRIVRYKFGLEVALVWGEIRTRWDWKSLMCLKV